MWKQQRRFALFTLKYFGVGKKSLEFSILDEFMYISKEISNHKGKESDVEMPKTVRNGTRLSSEVKYRRLLTDCTFFIFDMFDINCPRKPFNPHLIMNNAVSNIICSLVFGHRFEYGNEKFLKMMKLFDKGSQIEASIWAQVLHFLVIDGSVKLCTAAQYSFIFWRHRLNCCSLHVLFVLFTVLLDIGSCTTRFLC